MGKVRKLPSSMEQLLNLLSIRLVATGNCMEGGLGGRAGGWDSPHFDRRLMHPLCMME